MMAARERAVRRSRRKRRRGGEEGEGGGEGGDGEEDGEEPQKVCSVITLSSSPYWCLLPILKVYWVQGLRPSILAVT